MDITKLYEIVSTLFAEYEHGDLIVSTGGEIAFDFTSQPSASTHAFLKRKGFVLMPSDAAFNADCYIYRPIIRRARAGKKISATCVCKDTDEACEQFQRSGKCRSA